MSLIKFAWYVLCVKNMHFGSPSDPSQTAAAEVKLRCVYSILKPHGQSFRRQIRLLPSKATPREFQTKTFIHFPIVGPKQLCVYFLVIRKTKIKKGTVRNERFFICFHLLPILAKSHYVSSQNRDWFKENYTGLKICYWWKIHVFSPIMIKLDQND